MSNGKHNLGWGIFLVILGAVFLIGNLSDVSMEMLWPVFPLAVGLAFIVGYLYNRSNFGLLMPGSIFMVIGFLFLYLSIFGWWHMEDLWPVFIIAPSVGFLAMYFGGTRDKGLLVPAGILGGLGLIFFFISAGMGGWWPVLLILAGGIILARHFLMGEGKSDQSES